MAEVSRYKLENGYTDSTGSNDLAAAGSGNSFSTSIVKRGTYSLQLNGSGYASKTSGVSGITGANADRSMGGFFYSNTASAVESIMAVGNASPSQGFTIIKLSATTIRVDLYADALGFTVPTLSNNTWYWCWVQYTASGAVSDLYLDNVQSSSGAQAHAGNSNLVTNHIYLGTNDDANPVLDLTGNLDDMRIWNGVTSAGDRTSIFTLPSATAGLTLMMTMLSKASGNFKLLNGLILDPKNANPTKLLNYYSGMLRECDPKRLQDILNWRERKIKAWEKLAITI